MRNLALILAVSLIPLTQSELLAQKPEKFRHEGKTIKEWIDEANSGKEKADAALAAAARFGPKDGAAVKELTFYLSGKETGGRRFSIRSLQFIGPNAKSAVPELIKALNTPGYDWEAAMALGAIGPDASEALEPLFAVLKNFNAPPFAREMSGEAMHKIYSKRDDKFFVGMANALNNEKSPVGRTALIKTVALYGRQAKTLSSDLVNILKDASEDVGVRRAAAHALARIPSDSVLSSDEFVDMLNKSEDPIIRKAMIRMVRNYKPPPKQLVEKLINVVEADSDVEVKTEAADVLRSIGPKTISSTEFVLMLDKTKNATVRQAIIGMAYNYDPPPKELVEGLIEILDKDSDNNVRLVICMFLIYHRGIDFDGIRQVPKLSRLSQETDELRSVLIKVSSKYGSRANEHVLMLVKMLENDPAFTVKIAAADALGLIDTERKVEVSILERILRQQQNKNVRASIFALAARYGPGAKGFVPELIKDILAAYKDEPKSNIGFPLPQPPDDDDDARTIRVEAPPEMISLRSLIPCLEAMNVEATADVSSLRTILEQETRSYERQIIVAQFGLYGSKGKEAVGDLVRILGKDRDSNVREKAAFALGKIGEEPGLAIPALLKSMEHDSDRQVKVSSARSLGLFGQDSTGLFGQDSTRVVAALIGASKSTDKGIAIAAIESLGEIGSGAEAAVPELKRSLDSKNWDLRAATLDTLGRMGSKASGALLDVTACAIKEHGRNRLIACSAVARIALETDDEESLKKSLKMLETSIQEGEHDPRRFPIQSLKSRLQAIEESKRSRQLKAIGDWLVDNPILLLIALYVPVLCSTWFLILWVRPLWLLRINDELRPFADISLPKWLLGLKVPLRKIVLVEYFNFHSRVLDAWVRSHLEQARDNFRKIQTVDARSLYVPLPVTHGGKNIADLKSMDLQKDFADERGCLLICGEGGSGKTTLACRIAAWAMSLDQTSALCKHAMLPILIEHDIDPHAAEGFQGLLNTIRGQLQLLIGPATSISDELLECLLRRGRLLVIVDHLSEMTEATRKRIEPENKDFAISALVVTSRSEQELATIPKSVLKPLRIEGNRLSSFMDAYLTSRDSKNHFTDKEFFAACGSLSDMVGSRNITVLLAKIFGERLIASKEQKMSASLPTNIPDLMLGYLNELNRNVVDGKVDDLVIHRDAKIVAWECLQHTFRPAPASREVILKSLGEDARNRLDYLENRVRLIQTVLPTKQAVCFSLDPLAEYLACLHLVESNGEKEDTWKADLAKLKSQQHSSLGTTGFLLALRDTCVAKYPELKLPRFVLEEVERLLLRPENGSVVTSPPPNTSPAASDAPPPSPAIAS